MHEQVGYAYGVAAVVMAAQGFVWSYIMRELSGQRGSGGSKEQQ